MALFPNAQAALNPQAEPQYVDPYQAQLQAYAAKLAEPLQRMYTPEQVQQRRGDNDRQYQLGMLAQLSGDQGLEGVGAQVFKQALAARQPKITERGTADQITGEFNYDPDYLRQRDELAYNALQQHSAAGQQQWNAQRQAAADRAAQQRQHDEDTRQTRTLIAGMTGMMGAGQLDGMVDALGQYKMDPATAFARMAPAARANLIAQVTAKYPDYDPTTYAAKAGGAKAFGAGPLGTQLRNFATANAHIDQMRELANALNNGDIQTVNRIGNYFGVQTGQAPVAVFNAVRQLVGPEITGAIVNGGGSAHERDQAAATFDPNSSPAQFAATIGAVRNLMQAKHDNLLAQRRALGLSDATQPDFNQHPGAPRMPSAADPLGLR